MTAKTWLTVHSPPREDGTDKEWLLHVFDKTRESRVQVGDMVFIYETETNPSDIEDGQTIKRKVGHKAIIALVRVAKQPIPASGTQILEDGRKHPWKWRSETKLVEFRYLPINKLRIALREPNFDAHFWSGLKPLSPEQYHSIYRKSKPPSSPAELRRWKREYLPQSDDV